MPRSTNSDSYCNTILNPVVFVTTGTSCCHLNTGARGARYVFLKKLYRDLVSGALTGIDELANYRIVQRSQP